MAENAWTAAEEAMLVAGFGAGMTPDRIADALRKTPGSVRWKLNRLGLVTLPCAPPGSAKPQYDEQDLAHRRGDLAFKRAMLMAIRAGTERAPPAVVRRRATHYVRRIIPVIESGYRSSAGLAADLGAERGGSHASAERQNKAVGEKRKGFRVGQIPAWIERGRLGKTNLENRMISGTPT